MKKLIQRVFAVFILFMIHIFSIGQSSESTITLRVGDQAPAIKVEKWVKGKPVTQFKKGHVYVVEFGGVGCAPCRAAIPHLSQLSKKYAGQATTVSVFTDNSVFSVDRFINKMGEKVAYVVAADGSKKAMQNTWTKPAGQNSIPSAFLVDKKSVIVWIGHPIDIEDVMIDDIINEQFDSHAAIIKQQLLNQLREKINIATLKGDFKTALIGINRLIEVNQSNPYYPIQKFKILLEADENKAYEYGRELLKTRFRDIESSLFYLARSIVEADESKLKKPDWALAIDLIERAIILCKSDETNAIMLKYEGDIFIRKGEYNNAIEKIEKAIKLVNNIPANEFEWKGICAYLTEVLAEYRTKLDESKNQILN